MITYSLSHGSNSEFYRVGTDFENLMQDICESMWAPGIFLDDHRVKKKFESAMIVALDFDDGLSLAEAAQRFESYKHIIGTTRSHQKEKNGIITDRFRVILFLEESIEDYKVYESTVRALLDANPEADPQAKDAARMFYPCVELVQYSEEGQLIPTVTPAPEKPRETMKISGVEGELTRETKDFLLFGAEPGTWNHRLYKAAVDAHNQGYGQDQFKDMAERMAPEPLDEKDLSTIKSAFSKDPSEFEHELRVSEEELEKLQAEEEAAANTLRPGMFFEETIEYLNDKDKVRGTRTNFQGLNKLMGGGLRGGELVALVAQAGAGKSSLFHSIQLDLAKRGYPVGYLCQEMEPSTEVIPNYLSMHYGCNVFKEMITPEQKEEYGRWLTNLPVFFTKERGHIAYPQIEAWVKHNKEKNGVNLFFLDHFAYTQSQPEDYKEASELARAIKTLAQKEQVNFFVIMQPQKLQFGQKLSMEMIRGGAALNQAADLILIMERHDDGVNKNVNTIRTEKARHKLARIGTIYTQYDPTDTNIVEIDLKDEVSDELGIAEKSFK